MRRFLIWSLAAVCGGLALFWIVPDTRVVLDLVPPVRTAVDAILPARPAPASDAAKAKGRGGPPAAPVTIATVVSGDMPVILTAPGTVEADATVAVKTRVDGQIAEVLFREGDLVEKEQVLFRLDDRLIKAQIRQAEANITRDQVNLAEAQATLERRNTLVQKRIVSEAAMDTAKTSVEALKASIAAGQAALEAQRTLLDYLVIKAPISGRTGATSVKSGSNVRAADTAPLVVINQIRPISVTFALPQTELSAMRRALASGAEAEIIIPGSKPVTRRGKIDFVDNQVDKQTGALTAKILVPNEDEALWPGQAVEVALNVETRKNMISVPASAVLPSAQGMIVWVVNGENRVSARPVILDRIVGQVAFLTEGVKPGESVVTDGQVRLAPNAAVTVRDPAAPKGPPAGSRKDDKGKGQNDKRS